MNLHRLLFYLLILLLPTQLGRHFWPSWSYIFGLKIDYLAPAVYLTDLLILGILGTWLGEKLLACYLASSLARNKRDNDITRYRHSFSLKPYWFFLSVFGFLLLNCFLAQNQGVAFFKLYKIIEFTFLGYYIVKERFKLADIYFPLSLAVLYSCLIAVCQFFKQSSLGGIFWWLGERTFNSTSPEVAKVIWRGRIFLRPYGTFSHPNSLAGFLLVSLILTFPYLFKKNKFFSFFYLIFSIFVLIISFSRAIFVTGIFICLIYFFLFSFGKKKRTIFFIYFFIFGIFFLIFRLHLVQNFFKEESVFRRVELNSLAVQMIKQLPFLGVGLNNFISQSARINLDFGFVYWLQPVHNIFLLVASETGLIGLFLFIFLFKNIFFNLLSRKEEEDLLLLISVLIILLSGMADHYWLTLPQNQLLLTLIISLTFKNEKYYFKFL